MAAALDAIGEAGLADEIDGALKSAVRPGNAARKGKSMKALITALALCALTHSAFAASPDCRAVESNSARLACFDAALPPKTGKSKAVENKAVENKAIQNKPVENKAIESEAGRPPYTDPFLAENARTTSKLNNICRGC